MHPIRKRVLTACDTCKARKVKCNGLSPCLTCLRRDQAASCQYTAPYPPRRRGRPAASLPRTHAGSTPVPRADADDPDVPQDAQLHHDTHGAAIFIGDCAPLSFFQTVRQLVVECIDTDAFARDLPSLVISAGADTNAGDCLMGLAQVEGGLDTARVLDVCAGLLDPWAPGDEAAVAAAADAWLARVQQMATTPHTASAQDVRLALLLALSVPASASVLVAYAQRFAFSTLLTDLTPCTLHVFLLLALATLQQSHLNSAFLVIGLASRCAYTLGVHRSEINARFGAANARWRNRLWKSLRVLDLGLAIALGRPPATSDVDCSVGYTADDDAVALDMLGAHVQILLVAEKVVVQVYSRKKISAALTQEMAARLSAWAGTWHARLEACASAGAVQVLSTYYHAVILLTRPFLMYDLRRAVDPSSGHGHASGSTDRSVFAWACLDAARLLADTAARSGDMRPFLSSWLLSAGLVLSAGHLGGFGGGCAAGAEAAQSVLAGLGAAGDLHAAPYAGLVSAVRAVAQRAMQERERREEKKRREAGRQLFGLPGEAETQLHTGFDWTEFGGGDWMVGEGEWPHLFGGLNMLPLMGTGDMDLMNFL